MPFISITRLRVRSIRFLPAFALYTYRSLQQVKNSPGFQGGNVLPDRKWAFWTMTAWDSQESMRRFMTTGPHKSAMPRLLHWCDEASVVHWEQPETALPSWTEADQRMRTSGRALQGAKPQPPTRHLDLPHTPPLNQRPHPSSTHK